MTKWLSLLIISLAAFVASAQDRPEWTRPHPPFRIAGNLYYVGSDDLASFLIATPQGLILINSNLESSPALIEKSVEQLGFKFSNIKILLISHAHWDHCAGSADIIRRTGAKYYVMDADVPVVESGGRSDFQYGGEAATHFPKTHVDRALHDNETISLGGTVLTAHLTPGHTKGTTTWTLDEKENGRTLHVVIVGSPNVNTGYKLVNNPRYPQIASDYEKSFALWKALPCDVFLGAHGAYFDMAAKYERWQSGDKNAFVDPAGYKAFIAERQHAFETELAKQRAAK